jgi:Family of unknown function (DUF6011)
MSDIAYETSAHNSAPLAHNALVDFALAGNATFTVLNSKTSKRFTFRVRQCEDKPELYFISVLTGNDNTSDYAYLGTIRAGQYQHGRKSKIAATALSALAFAWIWNNAQRLPACIEVYHEGKCGRCGRALTVPESVASGFGPECTKKLAA